MTEMIQGMTNNGLRLLTLSQTGTKIEFTKLKVGDGFITNETVSELNDLINVIDEITIKSTDILEENGKISMVANGSIHQITNDFYFRELGLFAIDPETEKEVLYAYLNKGEDAGLIPRISSQASVQEAVSMIVTIGNATNIIVNYKDEKGLINSGHNMFDIVMKDHVLEDEEKRGLANFGEYVYKKETDDHLGYPEFYNTCLKEYQNATEKTIRTSKNYIANGTVQVREDEFKDNVTWGGFKRDSYVEQIFDENFKKDDEIVVKFKTSDIFSSKKGTTGLNVIFSMDNTTSKFGLILGVNFYQRKLALYASSNAKEWDIAKGNTGGTSLEPNTEYTVKLTLSDNQLLVYLNDQIEITRTCSSVELPYKNIIYGNCYSILHNTYCHKSGDTKYYARIFGGEITLLRDGQYCTYKRNSEEVYNTTTIKIAPNGHKFYNAESKEENGEKIEAKEKKDIDAIYNETGMAWLYGIDTENEYIIIPRNDYYFMNGNNTTVGEMIKAGLPNIKGHFGGTESGADDARFLDDAFYNGSYNTNGNGGSNSNDGDVMYFDASRVSSIYGGSTTVQTDAVKLIPYMVVGRISSFGVVGGTIILDRFISEEKLALSLEKFVTKTELDTKQNAGDYALKSDIAELPNKADKSDTYTKAEVDAKVEAVYKYRGEIANYESLPITNNIIGDVYKIVADERMYLWTGEKWQIIKDTFNANDYVTITDFETQITSKANASTSLAGYGIEDAYTKDEIDEKISNVYHAKGSVESYEKLLEMFSNDEETETPEGTEEVEPIELNIGDVYNVLDTGANYVWTGEDWDKLSETLDLSPYVQKSELPTQISEFENDSGYLTSIPAEYITEDKLNDKNYQTSEQVQTAINTALGDIETLLDEINGGM